MAQRFSTDLTPVLYYQARKRGEYVDIHEVGGLNPKEYDILLVGVDYNVLAEKKVEEAPAMVFGRMHRMIFPAVVNNDDKDKAHWVYFIIDTGSPLTYFSAQVNTLIYGNSV